MIRALPRTLAGCAACAGGVVTVALTGVLAGAAWIGTGAGERWVAGQLERRVSALTDGGRLDIGRLDLGLHGFTIRDVALTDASGRALVGADEVSAELRPLALLDRTVRAPRLRVVGASVDLRTDEDGVLDLVRLFGGPSAGPSEPFSLPVALDLADVELQDGNLRWTAASGATWAVAGLDGRLAVAGRDHRVDVSGIHLSATIVEPGRVPVRAAGHLTYDGDQGLIVHRAELEAPRSAASVRGRIGGAVDLTVALDRVDAAALDPLAGDVGLIGAWTGEVSARGDREVTVVASLRGLEDRAGAIEIGGRVDRGGPALAYTAVADLSEFRLEALLSTVAEPVVLDGAVRVEGQGGQLTGRWKGGAQTLYGQPVDRVDVPFAIDGSTLTLRDAELDGILGALVIDGTVGLGGGPLTLDVRGDLSADRLAALGADGVRGRGRIEAVVRADPSAGGPIEATGTVRYGPFAYRDQVTAAVLAAPFDLRIEGGRVEGEIALLGRGLEAAGATATRLEARGLRLVARDGDVDLVGPLAVHGLDWGGAATATEAAVDLRYAKRGVHQQVDAAVKVRDHTLIGRPGTGGTVAVVMRDDDLRFEVALDDLGRRVLTTGGRYDLAAGSLVLDRVAFAPTPRTTWTNAGPASMRLTDGGVADARLMLRSDLGTLAVTGTLGTSGALDGRVQVAALELDHLAELWPEALGGTGGRLDAVVTVHGDASDPVIDADVDLRGLYLDGAVRWLDADGTVRVEDGTLRPALSLAVAGEPLGRLEGAVPLTGGLDGMALDPAAPVDLRLAIAPGPLDRLAHLSPALDGTGLPEGRLSAVLTATDTLGDPVLHLAGVSEVAVPGWRRSGRVELDVTRRASAVSFDADLREGLATRATVGGEGTTRIGELFAHLLTGDGGAPDAADPELYLSDVSVAAALVGIPAASLAAIGGAPVDLGGELVGGVSVTGSPLRPVVDGAVNWLSPKIGGTRIDGAYLAFVPTGGAPEGYDLDLALSFPGGGDVAVRGTVPVVADFGQPVATWARGDLQLDVSGEGIPLAVLTAFDPRLGDGRGMVAVEGRIGGSPFDPRPELTARIDGGAVSIRDLGVTAEQLEAVVAMEGDRIRLERADFALVPTRRIPALDTERPRVRVVATTDLRDGAPSEIDARITLSGGPWLAATEATKLRADGDVRVEGEWPALRATGELDLVFGRLQLDASALAGDTPLRVDPALTIHRGAVAAVPAAPPEPPIYADFDVAIDLDLNRNLELAMRVPFVEDLGEVGAVLSSADLSARLGGALRVTLADQQPTLVGEVEVVEGKVRVLRSNLALQEGTISFAGGDPYTDASLDLSGVMAVEGGELELAIRGPLAAPTFETRSEAFPDPAEQWTILLTGQSPDELSSGQAAGAAQALAGLFVNRLLTGQTLGTLSVEPDNSVRLGVPVTPRIYATSTFAPLADLDDNALSLALEWALARRVVASGGIGDQVQWGDLFWEIRF